MVDFFVDHLIGCSVAIGLLIIVSLCAIPFGLTALFPVKTSHVGYITATDNNNICVTIYVKTDLQSGQEDSYDIPQENYNDFKEIIDNTKNNRIRSELTFKEMPNLLCVDNIVNIKNLTN